MSFRAIENDIKDGMPNRAAPILLFGDEPFLVHHYERQLASLCLQGAASDLDLSVFYGDEQEDDQIMGALDTFPMLALARVVIVKNHPGLSGTGRAASAEGAGNDTKKKGGLAEYLAQLPDTARLIFSSGNVNKTRALFKAITKHGSVYEFSRLDETDLVSFVRKRFKAMGTDLAPEVLDAFVFASGYLEKDTDRDLFSIENDIFKLSTFALSEGRSTVAYSDIEECLPSVLRSDVFAMLDAISAGRKGEAIRLLENSLVGGESAFRLLSLFIGHFEIMLGYKEFSAEGKTSTEITKLLGERSDWRVKKLGGFAQRFEISKLQAILGRFYGLEREIKSGNLSERLALTVALAEI